MDTDSSIQPVSTADSESWVDQFFGGISAIQQWGATHPDFVLLLVILVGLLVLVFGLGWFVSKMPVAASAQPSSGDTDFAARLGVSREDLAEVGLPLMTGSASQETTSSDPPRESLEDWALDDLMVVIRYCVLKGDKVGVREAIAPVLTRGDAAQRKAALALLDRFPA